MGGIWAKGQAGTFQPVAASGFVSEADLHDLIERTPSMLPLAGGPKIAVVGREVQCGREWADLVAVEVNTGRPVVIEVKLAANTDRRQALTQVLGYAAYLRRLDASGLGALLQPYLTKSGFESIAAAAGAAAQDDPGFAAEVFAARLDDALSNGRLRAVIVLDAAPPEFVELVGYLQEVTNDRLSLDLVVVTSYDIAGQRVLVPQLVEPDRSQVTAASAGVGKPAGAIEILAGGQEFESSISVAPQDKQEALRLLYAWACELERDGLANLYTSRGKGRWVLNLRLPGQSRGMVLVWNENGPYLSPYRTVFQHVAPNALSALDAKYPGEILQGNYIKARYDGELLALLRAAYVEARSGRSG